MVEIRHTYDIEKERVVVTYENNLLKKHSDLFDQVASEVLPNIEIKKDKESTNTKILYIPCKKESAMTSPGLGIMSVALPMEMVEGVDTILSNFIIKASLEEMKSLEIIPLKNYEMENIKKDVQEAVKNKRNLCVIEDYNDYLSGKNVIINCKDMKHAVYEFASSKYCDVVLACVKEDRKELSDLTEKDLKLIEWM